MLMLPKDERSYWRGSYVDSEYGNLNIDLEVDVAVIGAGITGLTSAYLLKQSGLTVAVLEKSTIGGGTTGRTTGKVTSQHNLIYSELNSHLGKSYARLYGEANQAALEQVNSIVVKEQINCNWHREDNYVYTTKAGQVETLKKEAKIATELGLPASFEATSPLPFAITGAVKFENQAKIDSQLYLLGLARAVQGNGCFVYENSEVIRIKDGNPAQVKTKQGKITAKHVIVATNVPTMPLVARGTYCMSEYPKESYIIACLLPKKYQGMYISPDKDNYSILPIVASDGFRLLVGGEGHISGLRGNVQARYQRLADFAEKQFGVTEITHRWSDRDYLAYDNVPLIGKLYPWSKNLYVATAMMKWGLSNGTVAAMILNDLITKQENAWSKVFDSCRTKPIKSIPRVAGKYLIGKG